MKPNGWDNNSNRKDKIFEKYKMALERPCLKWIVRTLPRVTESSIGCHFPKVVPGSSTIIKIMIKITSKQMVK